MQGFLCQCKDYIDTFLILGYIHQRHGGVAKLVIAPACQAGDRGFNPRRSR